jgi:hypothetical protein
LPLLRTSGSASLTRFIHGADFENGGRLRLVKREGGGVGADWPGIAA